MRRLKVIAKCLTSRFIFLNEKKVKASNGWAETKVLFNKTFAVAVFIHC